MAGAWAGGGVLPVLPARVPGGARVRDNLAALQTSLLLADQDRPCDASQRQVLSRWRSWGAVPQLFDPGHPEFEELRGWLGQVLSPAEYAAARRTTINAHYTDPGLVGPIWELVERLGYQAGAHRVLEPGCGAGGFLAGAPGSVEHFTGIELDPTTARIAQQLFPAARIVAESFADSRYAPGTFDVVIGNVPFSQVALHDPIANPGRQYAMHNHFIIKSLELTAPGGLVALLTSRFTLDSRSAGAREAMLQRADLLGAVRLPTGAHRAFAGTDAVTDLLVLRRRAPQAPPGSDTWLATVARPELDGEHVNAYFVAHPEQVLGRLELGSGMHGARTVRVVGPEPGSVPARFAQAVHRLGEELVSGPAGQAVRIDTDPRRVLPQAPRPVALAGDPTMAYGFLSQAPDGTIMRRTAAGGLVDAGVPASRRREVAALLELRDLALSVLTLQAADRRDTEAMLAARRRLGQRYRDYVGRYGPINRFTVRESTRAGGQKVSARYVAPAVRDLNADPFAGTVKALELFDEQTQSAREAAIFDRRVVAPRRLVTSAESPADALAIVLDRFGRVELDAIGDLLGLPEEQARAALGQLVYADPQQDGRLVPAAAYLSGNVRIKLAAAQEAAGLDPHTYAVNVSALEGVVPADLGPQDIAVRLGAVWVPAADVQAFLQEILADPRATVHHDGGSHWVFEGDAYSVAARVEWGTERRSVFELAESLAGARPIVITDTVKVGDRETRVVNYEATAAAQEKAAALNERFAAWLWEDPARAGRLTRRYNDLFNALVMRSYDDVVLTLPGLAATFTPRPHQVAAVARMIAEPSVGLWHEVGAGKTAEMVMGTQELRRLGLVNKPAIVVPNHMLEQFTREYLQLYPQAQVLAASSRELSSPPRRQDFAARVALGDWDAVILTQTAFEKIPVSGQAEARYIEAAAQDQQERMDKAAGRGDLVRVKTAEKRVLAAKEKAKAALDRPRDGGLTFEMTGIDYLCIDEAHLYKNLTIESHDRSLSKQGSARATDLDLKIEVLRRRSGAGGRVVTFATATPIANSVSEMYVMQHYLRPDLLRQAGLTDFDSWAGTFGRTTTDLELDPAGGGYRMKTRFAAFTNIPELLRLWGVAADVKTAADLDLPVPLVAARPDGERAAEVVAVEAPGAVLDYLATLRERAEAIRGGGMDSRTDNMLTVTNDGRAAALDLRLLGHRRFPPAALPEPGEQTKLSVAAERIARLWAAHRDRVYLDDNGAPHPVPGALQIVFCDLGTPNDRGLPDVYHPLRDHLVARGMAPARIRFMQQAKKDEDKARLFAACRAGGVDVIIGSTETMGVGTNIQARAIALHHLDCPWRPADIAQRDGRILRQGNQNEQVYLLRYATKRSFDAYMWQTQERKAKFTAQVMRGSIDVREMEDIGNAALSAAEAAALASDDPNALRRAQLQAQITKLERAETAHHRGQSAYRQAITWGTTRLAQLQAHLPGLQAATARRVTTRGKAFTMTVQAVRYTDRPEAGTALARLLHEAAGRVRAGDQHGVPAVATVGGQTFDLTINRRDPALPSEAVLAISDVPAAAVTIDLARDLGGEGTGLAIRLENQAARLEALLEQTTRDIDRTHQDIGRARTHLGAPFTGADELDQLRQELTTLNATLTAQAQERDQHTTPDAPDAHAAPEEAAAEPAHPTPADAPQSTPAGAPLSDAQLARAQARALTRTDVTARDPRRQGGHLGPARPAGPRPG